MTAAIGVLCARGRVEEKQLIAALAAAKAPTVLLDPTCPLPFTPTPPVPPGRAGGFGRAARADWTGKADRLITTDTSIATVILDRCKERTLAAAVLSVWRALGATILDAGLAATGNRAVVAAAFATAGLPRPVSFLATDDDAAIATLTGLGYPATLLPLALDGAAVTLHDQDTAEAVFEHRAVLGSGPDRIAVIQAGVPVASDLTTILVVGGEAVAADDPGWVAFEPDAAPLAVAAARAIDAVVVGVTIARIEDEIVIWDVLPVPDFRAMPALGARSVADAIATLALVHLGLTPVSQDAPAEIVAVQPGMNHWREVAGGVALIA